MNSASAAKIPWCRSVALPSQNPQPNARPGCRAPYRAFASRVSALRASIPIAGAITGFARRVLGPTGHSQRAPPKPMAILPLCPSNLTAPTSLGASTASPTLASTLHRLPVCRAAVDQAAAVGLCALERGSGAVARSPNLHQAILEQAGARRRRRCAIRPVPAAPSRSTLQLLGHTTAIPGRCSDSSRKYGGLTAKTAPASYNQPSSQTVEVLAVETLLLIAAVIGMISGSLAIVTAIYAGAKRLVAHFRKDDGSLSPPMTMVNWIAIGLETTIIVPVVIETVIEKVVPVFVPPQSPRPTIPEWLTRPKQPPEVRPDARPDKSRPSFTRPGSRPSAPEYTHRRPEITTRRAEADVDYATRLGGRGGVGSPPRSGSPPDGSGPGSVDRGFQGGTNPDGSPGDHRR